MLNPDAEVEFSRDRYDGPDRKLIQAMQDKRASFDALVQGEPAAFLHELKIASSPTRALLWCATPYAKRRLAALGYELGPTPDGHIVRAVNSKEFLVTSDLPAPSERFFWRSRSAFDTLRRDGTYRFKREYGFAGRGSRNVSWPPRADDELFLTQSLRKGGVLVEPRLSIFREYSIHGALAPDPTLEPLLGRACEFRVDTFGSVVDLFPSPNPPTALSELGAHAATLLRRAGYFGPFGLDVLETEQGLVCSDLNARMTLGFSYGLGPLRARALQLILGQENA